MFDGVALKDWLTGTGIVIVILVGAVIAASKWKSGGIREAAAIFGVVLIVCLIVALSTHLTAVGDGLYALFFG